jgi:PAS domain S-box-containing protein
LSRRGKKDFAEGEGYRRFIEFAPVGLYEAKFDPPRFMWVNEEMCRILDYTRKELLEMNPLDFTDEAGKQLFLEMVKRNLAGERVEPQAEFKIKTKDGRELWASINATFTRKNGVVDGALVVAQDITERKEIERSLRESRKKYQDLIETTSDFVWEVDAQGRYTYCSPQMEKLWGLKPAEMIGKSPFDRMSPASKEKALELFAEMVKSPKPFSGLETSGHDREGRVIFHETDEVPFFDEHGTLLGFRGITRDVTERKKSREALQKEKSILQEVMNGAENMHLVYLDRDFNFVRVNEAYAKTCGYKPEEIIGKNHFALYPDEENEAIFKRVRDTGVTARFHDKPFVFPDQPEKGVTYWDWTLKPVKDGSGKVEGFVFSLVETTERKKAEEELIQTQNRLSIATKAAKIGIHDYDIVANTVQWDERIREIWGVELDEPVTYETFIENVHPDDRAAVQAEMNKALDPKRGDFYAEYRVINRKDKKVRWVYATGKTFFDDSYNAVRLIGTAEDITERKKAEAALFSSEKRYHRLFETSQDGIMARDLNGCMIDCNQAYAKMVGYSKEELMRLPVDELLPEKWHEQRNRIFREVLETGDSAVFEREYRRKDGVVFPASVRSWRLTDENGEIIGVWSIVRDITRQKELERKLQDYAANLEKLVKVRTMQLKDAERLAAIGSTAGMVGHDIRNPLQAIVGDLYLAKSDLAAIPENEEKAGLQESLAEIEKNVEYIDKIVQDLQDFAKPLNPVARETDLEDACNEVLFKSDIEENVEASYEVQNEAKKLISDPDLLKRILSNLVSNAVQAMPMGGKLMIQGFKDDDAVVIMVEDTGVGIPEEVRSKLFTPLFTTKAKGQGFGLAVIKRMTEALGGSVTFESEVGKGTKFIVRLPQKS